MTPMMLGVNLAMLGVTLPPLQGGPYGFKGPTALIPTCIIGGLRHPNPPWALFRALQGGGRVTPNIARLTANIMGVI